jgi:hypothetical protein
MTGPATDTEPARIWHELGRRGSHAALQLAGPPTSAMER